MRQTIIVSTITYYENFYSNHKHSRSRRHSAREKKLHRTHAARYFRTFNSINPRRALFYFADIALPCSIVRKIKGCNFPMFFSRRSSVDARHSRLSALKFVKSRASFRPDTTAAAVVLNGVIFVRLLTTRTFPLHSSTRYI